MAESQHRFVIKYNYLVLKDMKYENVKRRIDRTQTTIITYTFCDASFQDSNLWNARWGYPLLPHTYHLISKRQDEIGEIGQFQQVTGCALKISKRKFIPDTIICALQDLTK